MRQIGTALVKFLHPVAAWRTAALALALIAMQLPATRADAQCPPDACDDASAALWLGDLTNDNAINALDVTRFQECWLPGPFGNAPGGYCEAADFNFDGVTNQIDLDYLVRLVQLNNDPAIKKLPRGTLSELRVRKPLNQTAPAIPQSRFVEIRTPLGAASLNTADPPSDIQSPTVNGVVLGNEDVRVFQAGWFYLKVLRSVDTLNPTVEHLGTIAVVVPLDGMVWVSNPLATQSRGLGVVIDGSWAGSPLEPTVPISVQPFLFNIDPASLAVPPVAAGLNFSAENNANTTHMLVFRDPNGPRALPAVGQRVNLTGVCDIAFQVTPGPNGLPPFDAIVDCVTVVRSTNESGFGCIFAGALAFHIGPVGSVGSLYAPPHVYRCRNAGTWTRGTDAISANSDTPFVRNLLCSQQVQGCGELGPDGLPRDCFEPQSGPGCSDADCCNAVCNVDPSCCTTAWDGSCAVTATQVCTECGVNPSSCFVAHQTPSCVDKECCNVVCNFDPSCCETQWDATCAHIASKACLACGDSKTGACNEVHDLPYCNDQVCCMAVCDVDPFCCDFTWDQPCVDIQGVVCQGCGSLNSGDCCVQHPTPYCKDAECCNSVCQVDFYCCDVGWDLGCTQLALVYCPQLNCACGSGGSCFLSHSTPGCTNSYCCQTVCVRDPFCCLVKWDRACTLIAADLCATNANCLDANGLPVLGSCFVPHEGSGCDQPGCCSQVCAQAAYAYCCTDNWDAACAVRAADICDKCGEMLAGSCFSEHGTPNCSNTTCCNRVCDIDPFCCTDTWDSLCVVTAVAQCAPPVSVCGSVNTRSCWIPNYTPGCTDNNCCKQICTRIDPYCCDARWDAVCAKEANYFCIAHFTWAQGQGGCLTPHAERGCANLECSKAVCSVDPTCCSQDWDERCVDIAAAVCTAPGVCPAPGDCMQPHLTAGCDNTTCCAGVCNTDPTCCDAAWDATCANTARDLCRVPLDEDWPCPCRGECVEAHDNPGCKDTACCAIVCHVDPYCCEEIWDTICALGARQYCCGPIGCGSGCNEDCLIPHERPYCNDPYCCDSVCRADPICCAYSWDSICVAAALERCAGACGLQAAGDCFIPHDFPSCRNGTCCAAICRIDPSCCTETWDTVCVDLANAPGQASVCKRTECGATTAGPCCEPHDSQGCNNEDCCDAVCKLDPYCCETEWDSNCTDEARDVPGCGCVFTCGDDCAGDCCRAHANNACNDAECCAAVCLQDSYCCEVEWDAVCAATARSTCTARDEACPVPPCGSDQLPSCCVPGFLPNCSKEACCNAVCNVDPFCCEIQWDSACAEQAQSKQFQAQCGCEDGGCGDPNAGSCFQEHTDPFCADGSCCATICAFDPTCCAIAWDEECVLLAQFFCDGSFAALQQAFSDAKNNETADRPARVPPPGWIPPRLRAQPPQWRTPTPPIRDGSATLKPSKQQSTKQPNAK